jgi:hypothetical protein
MTHRILTALAILLSSSPAFAAADLSVSVTPPAAQHVYQNGTFDVIVANIGNQNARNVSLSIDLPQTNTSPTVHIMGDLGAFDSRCSLSGQTLTCGLGTIRKNKSETVSFDIALPYSTAPLNIDVAASSSPADANPANNSLTHVASLLTYDVTMSLPEAVINRHCTGQGLTSFFECELYPSSITSHAITFNSGGSITFASAPAGYTGTWSQPAPDRLLFQYYDNGNLVASFDGRGVSSGCFEGATTFPNSSYLAMYEVCL